MALSIKSRPDSPGKQFLLLYLHELQEGGHTSWFRDSSRFLTEGFDALVSLPNISKIFTDHQALLSLSCLINRQYRCEQGLSHSAAGEVWRRELRKFGGKMGVWEGELGRLEREGQRVFGISGE